MTLRVLHLIHTITAQRGGPSRSVPTLCRAQQQQGAQVRLMAQASRGDLPPELALMQQAGVELSVLPLGALLRRVPAAMRWADVVHIHGIWTPLLHGLSPLARALGRPVVFTLRGMLEEGALTSKALRKRLALRLIVAPDLQRASLLHATGEPEAEQLRRLGLRAPILIVPNGVDGPPAELLASGGKAEGHGGYVVYLGRLHPHKGLPMLLSACAQLRAALEEQGLRVRLVGPDVPPHREQLGALIGAHHLSGLVTLEDPVEGDEKWRLLAGAQWVVLPSHSENFGMSVAEGLIAGTPALTTTTTPWQALEPQGCGLQVPATPAGIGAGMRALLERSAAQRAEMGARGRAFMLQHYAWGPIAARLLEAYRDLLGG